jgi:DNA mismatch endonuclease (patch repair protein)
MRAVRQAGTDIELALRSVLHRRGLRFRIDRSILPNSRRRADVVFVSARVAVFIDGCFWHCCPLHGTTPKSNRRWWRAKLESNRRRDTDTDRRLTELGWRVIRIWEHEGVESAACRIAAALKQSQRPLSRPHKMRFKRGKQNVRNIQRTGL